MTELQSQLSGRGAKRLKRTDHVLVKNAADGRQSHASDWTTGLRRPDDLQEWSHVFQRRNDRPVCRLQAPSVTTMRFLRCHCLDHQHRMAAPPSIRVRSCSYHASGRCCDEVGGNPPAADHLQSHHHVAANGRTQDHHQVISTEHSRRNQAQQQSGAWRALTEYCLGIRAHLAFCRMLLSTAAISAFSKSACVCAMAAQWMLPLPVLALRRSDRCDLESASLSDQARLLARRTSDMVSRCRMVCPAPLSR